MQKDSVHYGGWEHRDVHNINGMLFVWAPHHFIKFTVLIESLVKPNLASTLRPLQPTETALRLDPFLLRGLPPLRRNVDG